MTTVFPTSLDSFTNPSATDSQKTVSHSAQHDNINDAVAALEAKVGIDSSADANSLDYKVRNKVSSVTGLNTDNTDPANPIVKISVDGSTITGSGTPADPLVSTASGSIPQANFNIMQ